MMRLIRNYEQLFFKDLIGESGQIINYKGVSFSRMPHLNIGSFLRHLSKLASSNSDDFTPFDHIFALQFGKFCRNNGVREDASLINSLRALGMTEE